MNKNILFPVYLILSFVFLLSCSTNDRNQAIEDSIRRADSIARIEEENARIEALRQDSIMQAQSAKYDKMISECEALAKKYNRSIKKYQDYDYESGEEMGDPASDYEKFVKKYKQIIEIIDNLSPEQFKRVENIEKTTIHPNGILWG